MWQKGSTFLEDQTNAMLVIGNVQPADAGSYAAISANLDGTGRSQFANVIVCSNEPCNFPWVWMKNFYGSGTDYGSSPQAMATDSQGNIYVTGYGVSSTTRTDFDYLTLKLGPDGQLIWAAVYGDASQNEDRTMDLALDSSGNCYVTGCSYSLKPTTEGDNDYLTLKYNAGGEKVWEVRYNSTTNGTAATRNDEAYGIVVDAAGCAYVTGNHGTLKYDTLGKPLWTNGYGGFFIALSTNDNSVVVAPGFGTGGIKKLSASGNELWEAPVTNVHARLRVGSDGSIYAAAAYGFDWFASRGDIQTVKLGSNGVPIWTQFYNSPFDSIEDPTALDVDRDGNVFVAGVVHRADAQQVQQTGALDILLLKYNSDGDLLWAVFFNDSANQQELPYDLGVDQDGSIFIVGATEWESTGQQRAALLLKYDAQGNRLWTSRYRSGPVGANYFYHLSTADDGTLVVAGESTFRATSGGYQQQFLVGSFAQNAPRLAMAGVPAPGVRQGCLVSARGTQFDILANTDLATTNWHGIGTVTNVNGLVPFFDTDAGQHPMRFYRARASGL